MNIYHRLLYMARLQNQQQNLHFIMFFYSTAEQNEKLYFKHRYTVPPVHAEVAMVSKHEIRNRNLLSGWKRESRRYFNSYQNIIVATANPVVVTREFCVFWDICCSLEKLQIEYGKKIDREYIPPHICATAVREELCSVIFFCFLIRYSTV